MINLVEKSIVTIESREVAKMLGVEHWKLIRKLEGSESAKMVGIVPTLADNGTVVSDYFIPSVYKDNSGKENKCYLFTKLGCDFIANKFTGEKGILFTAKYVKRFNEMEKEINSKNTTKQISSLEAEKVEAQKARAQAMLLNAQNRTYKTLMSSIENKNLAPVAVQVFGLKGLESVFGVDVGNYLPKTDKTYSAAEVGNMLGGISAQRIGTIANNNNLKADEYGMWVLDKSRYSNKEVNSFRYNEKAIDKFKEILGYGE